MRLAVQEDHEVRSFRDHWANIGETPMGLLQNTNTEVLALVKAAYGFVVHVWEADAGAMLIARTSVAPCSQ